MPMYQLRYLSGRGVAELVDAESPDEAEDLARRRLLFSEPGFAIAILFEGVELGRVIQRSKALNPKSLPSHRVAHSRGCDSASAADQQFPELSP